MGSVNNITFTQSRDVVGSDGLSNRSLEPDGRLLWYIIGVWMGRT